MSVYQINRSKFLIEAELDALNRALQDDCTRNGLLLRTALETGARAQELLNIETTDLDDKYRTVSIRGLKNSNDRDIPISKKLYEDIKSYSRTLNTTKVFPISYQNLVLIWDYYSPAKHKSFKCIRHTTAIELIKKTGDLLLVKTLLGHRNIMNTMVYADYIYQTTELRRKLRR